MNTKNDYCNCNLAIKMSEGKVFVSEVKSMDEDEPEEGEIQDDGSLEDVSSDEDISSTCSKKNCESYYDNKYTISHVIKASYATRSSLPQNNRVSKIRELESKRFPTSTEESQPRLNVKKYREETNKLDNDVIHMTVNTVVSDCGREDRFAEMLSEYKSVRPKQSVKDKDIVQEKENRRECQKETKLKRKCRRKRRHSLLNNPTPEQPLSSDSKTGIEVGNKKVEPREEGKKRKESFNKLGTKSKISHSKRRSVSPKREKHRCSKKKGGRKCFSKRMSNETGSSDCTVEGVQGTSLLKRLQPMMTVNVSVGKENALVENVEEKNEDNVQSQELDHGLHAEKSDNENYETSLEKTEILKEANQNHPTTRSSHDIEAMLDPKKPEPVVITIEDSDSDPQISIEILENDLVEKTNKGDEIKMIEGGDTSAKGTDDDEEDEDLVQLRLLALQSNRRKETAKPRAEDDEVMQLRLAALKSAILKKFEVRKQRGVILKSKEMNTLNSYTYGSPSPSDLENDSMKDDSDRGTPKPEITSVETLQSEPDETTTLVDMDLSHTDDESSAQNGIIIEPVSADIPLPEDSANTFLQLIQEDYNTQNIPCSNESLKVHEHNSMVLKQDLKENNVVTTWNPSVMTYRGPDVAKFDLENCQLSGIYSSNLSIPSLNSVGYSSSQLPFSSFSQQQLYNEFYHSSNNTDLPSADLDGVPLEAISSPFDSSVSAVSGSFMSSSLSDAILASRVEPQVFSANSFIPRMEAPSLKTESTSSKTGKQVSRASSVTSTKGSQFINANAITLRTGTEVQRTNSITYRTEAQFDTMDLAAFSSQNWNKKRKRPSNSEVLHSKNRESGSGSIFPVSTEFSYSSMIPQIQELKQMDTEVLPQGQYVSVTATESVENKVDCNVEENRSELENIDLSNMIVLDEVGRCSSPDAKGEEIFNEPDTSKTESTYQQWNQSLDNLDEDEEILRAKVLTTLARTPSTSAAVPKNIPENIKDSAVTASSEMPFKQETKTISKTSYSLPSVLPSFIPPNNISSSKVTQHTSIIHGKEEIPSKISGSLHELKRCTKIIQGLSNKKLEHSNSIRAKVWKKSVKKVFTGTNKQMLTVNRNPGHMKQLREHSATFSNGIRSLGIGPKTSVSHCKLIGNSVSRAVFHSRVSKPTTIQVTVPAKCVDDERGRRKIADGINSVAPIQVPQRFVIRLGEDSDSPDEEDKQQMTQAPKRRLVIKNSPASLLPMPTPSTLVVPCDPLVNYDSTVFPPSSQVDRPVTNKKNKASFLTLATSNSRISADFEKSVDMFLKQARKSQEARKKSVIQKTLTPNRTLGVKTNPMSSVTPLAVRHLPSSQQEEYRRLKRQIAELEEQKRCQQQPVTKNTKTNTKSASLPSSPIRTTVVSGSVKSPLKIVLTNTIAEKKEVSQSSLMSSIDGSDSRNIFRSSDSAHIQGNVATTKNAQLFSVGHAQDSEIIKVGDRRIVSNAAPEVNLAVLSESPSHEIVSANTILQKEQESVEETVCTATSPVQMSKKQPVGIAGKSKNLGIVMRAVDRQFLPITAPEVTDTALNGSPSQRTVSTDAALQKESGNFQKTGCTATSAVQILKEQQEEISGNTKILSSVMKASDRLVLSTIAPEVTYSALYESPSHGIVLQRASGNLKETICSATAPVQISKKQQGGIVGNSKNFTSEMKACDILAPEVTDTALIESLGHGIVSTDAVLQKEPENVKEPVYTTTFPIQMSKEQQGGIVRNSKNLRSVTRKQGLVKESMKPTSLKDCLYEVHNAHEVSKSKTDGLLSKGAICEGLVEEKQEKLAEIEHQLVSKRSEVLDDLTNMTTLLSQVEKERATEDEYLTEIRRLHEELCQAEERLAQQKELLSNMRNDMAQSYQRVTKGRSECISLSKTCLSLGICVKGNLYKVPAGGAECMNLKLQQVAAQTRRMSRKKEDSDENPAGNDVSGFMNLQMPVQVKTDIRTAYSNVESPKDRTSIYSKTCVSPAMDVIAENGSQEDEAIGIQYYENSDTLVSKTDISQPKCTSSLETLDFKLPEQFSRLSVPLSLTEESEVDTRTSSKSNKIVLVPSRSEKTSESDNAETEKCQDGVSTVIDIKRISTGESEELCSEAYEVMVMGMDSSSRETVPGHITEYRSPLEHFYSKRESGGDWCGPLDPLAILCPYELMGSCQDEECSFQHQTKNSTT